MKKLWKAAVALAVLSVCALTLYSQAPDKTSAQFRKAYLEKFPWTGMNTTVGDAMTLRILVESAGAKSGVEVGSNSGFGAINMGIGFERTGGRLTSLEIDPLMVQTARQHLAAVGLEKTVNIVQGDALQTIPKLEGQYDFVFIDALKGDYLKYFKLLQPKLTPHAILVADNVIESARQMADFLDYMQASPDWDSSIIRASMQKNDGMLVAYRIR
jgi:caffeoyl-CoA O-methyltransferase